MTISLIAAVGRNGAIGRAGGLPWRISTDMRHFKALTLGKPLVMGRKTYDSIGRPLPGRKLIVITRDRSWSRPEVTAVGSLEAALQAAAGADEIMIGGGGEIYALAMPQADRLYLTEVDQSPEADAFFPPVDPKVWREASREAVSRGPKDDADFAFVEYVRT